MLEDTFDSLEDDDMEEEAQEEIDKILFEVTQGVVHCQYPWTSFSCCAVNWANVL